MKDRSNDPKKRIMSDFKVDAPLKVIATHKVKKDETWTHLSLKYYGFTTEPYWRHIYEFNKDLIGDDYRKLMAGQEIKIPELPDELKDKD
jgi:nucleoid-associated protein YgaU